MPAPITANTIPVTQHAQQLFAQNAHDLSQVRDAVTSAVSQLTNTGMDPVSTDQLTAALQQWNSGLDDIISTSQWMGQTLGDTWHQMQKNEQDNTDLAAGITAQAEPAEQCPSMAATGGTVAPGQTIGFGMRRTSLAPGAEEGSR